MFYTRTYVPVKPYGLAGYAKRLGDRITTPDDEAAEHPLEVG